MSIVLFVCLYAEQCHEFSNLMFDISVAVMTVFVHECIHAYINALSQYHNDLIKPHPLINPPPKAVF